jgi:hypothetical protein
VDNALKYTSESRHATDRFAEPTGNPSEWHLGKSLR